MSTFFWKMIAQFFLKLFINCSKPFLLIVTQMQPLSTNLVRLMLKQTKAAFMRLISLSTKAELFHSRLPLRTAKEGQNWTF